jgi:hypothetical protein
MRSINKINRTNRNGVRIGYWEQYYSSGILHRRG